MVSLKKMDEVPESDVFLRAMAARFVEAMALRDSWFSVVCDLTPAAVLC